jgi:cell division protease FtsH
VVTFGQAPSSRFLPWAIPPGEARNYSEETARIIDAEVKAVLEQELARARDVVHARDAALRAIARELLARETLQRAELETLARTPEVETSEVRTRPEAALRAS